MMHEVNLIPAHRLAQRRQRAVMWRWIHGGTVYFVVTACACIGAQVIKPKPTLATGDKITEISAVIAQSQSEIVTLEAQLTHSAKILRAGRSIKEKPDWSLLLVLLGQVAGEDIVLRKCELQPVDVTPPANVNGNNASAPAVAGQATEIPAVRPMLIYELELGAFASSQTAASQFALRLEQTQLFDVVRLVKTTGSVYQEKNIYHVELKCTIGQRAEAQP